MAFCLVADTDFLNLLDYKLRIIERIPFGGPVSSMAMAADLHAYVAVNNTVHIFVVGTHGFGTAHTEKKVALDDIPVKVISVSLSGCVYILCGNYTVLKWSRLLQSPVNSIDFEAIEQPISLSCFGDTEDVVVGFNDGSFAIFDKYCIRKLKEVACFNIPVTVVHGKHNYILIGQRSGVSYYKIIDYILTEVRLLGNSVFGYEVVGGGICYNEWMNNQSIPDVMRLLIIAGTSDGRILVEFPHQEPVACETYNVGQTMFELKVTSHGLWMYAGRLAGYRQILAPLPLSQTNSRRTALGGVPRLKKPLICSRRP